MSISLYNSLTRSKETFTPVEDGKVSMYVCGPTVYSDCHIGHTMGPVLFDAVARWFAVRGYDVRFVNNITDIEDKIIAKANETGEPWQSITERYTAQYLGLLQDLQVTTVTDHPKCTEYIAEMIAFISKLVDDDRAYQAEDGVYFDVQKQDRYGKLSGRELDDMQNDDAGAKDLRHQHDFALWKLAKPDEPSWDSPWGAGRPGWHIECSVMSSSLLGGSFDIHGGGEELKFPHHENEIAQSEAHGDSYACCWMHNGLVQYEGKKVAKSDPRMREAAFALQFQARHLIDSYGGEAVRFHILRGHYRRPQEFKPEILEGSATTLARLKKQLADALGDQPALPKDLASLEAIAVPEAAVQLRDKFCSMMDDDFNTGAAISQLFPLAALARKASDEQERKNILTLVHGLGALLGLFADGLAAAPAAQADSSTDSGVLSKVMDILITMRNEARANRDFATADRIRDQLAEAGVQLTDGKDGTSFNVD